VITKFCLERIAKYAFEYAEGTGVIPVVALLLSSAMMIRHLQFPSFVDQLENSDKRVIWEGKYRTKISWWVKHNSGSH
nr:isocitrate dehydrogenase [NAD] regulatory subunit 1, mitochondrial [Tanacetum cinerariifolium]